jgi:hypothetical protein
MNQHNPWHASIRGTLRESVIRMSLWISRKLSDLEKSRIYRSLSDQRGDVPGWVLVVLMTTGLVTAIWTIAAPRLTAILKNSLDAMNGIR